MKRTKNIKLRFFKYGLPTLKICQKFYPLFESESDEWRNESGMDDLCYKLTRAIIEFIPLKSKSLNRS